MKNNTTENSLQEYLIKLQNDPKERAAMNKAWEREIKK